MRYILLFFFWNFAFWAYQINKLIIWLDRKFKFSLDFPSDVNELKKDQNWLVQELRNNNELPNNAEQITLAIDQLNPDLIFRSDTAKISLRYSQDKDEQEMKLIAKFSPVLGSVSNRAVYNIQQNHIKEINFYKYLAPRMIDQKAMPKAYIMVKNDATAHMCLVLEMLSEHIGYDEKVIIPMELVPHVMQTFATMHASFWGMQSNEVNGIMTIPQIVSDFLESSVWKNWNSNTIDVYRKNCEAVHQPQTIIHGDARVGNLLFHPTNPENVVFIDWQATRLSKGVYDVAYFLMLSVSVKKIGDVHAFVEHYHQGLVEKGVKDYTLEECLSDYNHACLMVLFMLSIPWLSGEGSYDKKSDSALFFSMGHYIWHQRLSFHFNNFEWEWMSSAYNLSIQACKEVVHNLLHQYEVEFMGLINESSSLAKKFAEAKESLDASV